MIRPPQRREFGTSVCLGILECFFVFKHPRIFLCPPPLSFFFLLYLCFVDGWLYFVVQMASFVHHPGTSYEGGNTSTCDLKRYLWRSRSQHDRLSRKSQVLPLYTQGVCHTLLLQPMPQHGALEKSSTFSSCISCNYLNVVSIESMHKYSPRYNWKDFFISMTQYFFCLPPCSDHDSKGTLV